MRKEVTIACKPFPWCRTEIAISDSGEPIMSTYPALPFTLSIRTGCSHLQTYATREELLALVEVINQAVSDEMWNECIASAKSNTGELNGSRA
jgi:hypothetical protein